MSIRFSFTLIIYTLLIVGCSSSAPTQANGAIFTQSVETAFSAILTNQPTATPTPIPKTSTPFSTNTPLSTNTPSMTSTPKPPSYEAGITSCEIDTSDNYPGWNIYNCGFWVKNNTNQIITINDFIKKNDETLRSLQNEYFYEQEDYLKPMNSGENGIYVSTSDNISYPADFRSLSDLVLIQPLRQGIPIHGYILDSDDGALKLRFLVPEAMQSSSINFPKVNLTISVPQPGIVQAIPIPEIKFANSFNYKVTNPKIDLTFREFSIIQNGQYKDFQITFDAINKDKTAQSSSEISFPYFIIDSNGNSYDDVQWEQDKIVALGPYSINLGPGQTDKFVMKFSIRYNPQFIYIVPVNLREPVVLIDTNNPQSTSTEIVTTNNSNSGGVKCNNFTSQLQTNMNAVVITEAINVRENSSTSQTIVGVIYLGDKVNILNEQPVCNEGFLWWKVQIANGITGWVVEGKAEERWLSP